MGALFDEVKRSVTAEDAARAYGLLRSDWQRKALCPWHGDKDPSLSFDRRTGRCYCFSCHHGGSSIDLTAQIFGLSPLDAAKKLNADFRLNADETSKAPAPIGESKVELRERYKAFLRVQSGAASSALREAERMMSLLDGLKDDDRYLRWIRVKENALEVLDWIDHLTFDEWRQEDASRKVWVRDNNSGGAGGAGIPAA